MQELLSKSNDIEIPKHNEDSRVEYLGMTPVNWLTTKLKFVYNIQLGKMLQNEPQNETDSKIPYFKAMHVQWENVEHTNLPKMWASLSDQETYTVKNGDLLVCEGGEVGRAAVITGLQEKAIIQNALHRVRPTQKSDIKYLMYLLRHIDFLEWFDVLCNKATIAHLTSEKLGNLIIPLPSKSEQHAIADFLDRETEKLDRLVEKKERLIELLREKRQALITQAVTKGLNPDVPMKDSGIEWLGEVPEHWEITKMKFIKSKQKNALVDGPFGSDLKSQHFVDNGDAFVVESNFAVSGRMEERALKTITKEHFEKVKRSQVKHGDIVIAKIGANFGMVSVMTNLSKPSVVSGNSMKLTVNKSICINKYVYYMLTFLKYSGAIDFWVNQTAQPALSLSVINNLPMLIPPKDEQLQIINWLEEKNEIVSILSNKLQIQIAKIKEYRQALISAAVTGKIDVRDEVRA